MNANPPHAMNSHLLSPAQRMALEQPRLAPTESQLIQQKAAQIAQAYATLWHRFPEEMKYTGKSSLKQAGKYDSLVATDIFEGIAAK